VIAPSSPGWSVIISAAPDQSNREAGLGGSTLLNIQVIGFIRTLVAATIGAILILFIWHWMHNRR
jgi:hypothetical protein